MAPAVGSLLRTRLAALPRSGRRPFSAAAGGRAAKGAKAGSGEGALPIDYGALAIESSRLQCKSIAVATLTEVARRSPVVSLAWRIPAGSRHEGAATAGASHHLRHALLMGNSRESALALVRRCELRGANVAVENDRDSITISVHCPREEAEAMLESVSHMLMAFALEPYDEAELRRRASLDRALYEAGSASRLVDAALAVAFPGGLANAPVSSAHDWANGPLSGRVLGIFLEEALARPEGHSIVAAGLPHGELVRIANRLVAPLLGGAGAQPAAREDGRLPWPPLGGSACIDASTAGSGGNHLMVAFGTRGKAAIREHLALQMLAHLMTTGRHHHQAARRHEGRRPAGEPRSASLLALTAAFVERHEGGAPTVAAQVAACRDGGLLAVHLCDGHDGTPASLRDAGLFERLLECLGKDLQRIATDGALSSLEEAHLEAVKRHMALSIVNAFESTPSAAALLSDHLHASPSASLAADHVERLIERELYSISAADLYKVAAESLTREGAIRVALGNLKAIPLGASLFPPAPKGGAARRPAP